jgi:hypothetical protein
VAIAFVGRQRETSAPPPEPPVRDPRPGSGAHRATKPRPPLQGASAAHASPRPKAQKR